LGGHEWEKNIESLLSLLTNDKEFYLDAADLLVRGRGSNPGNHGSIKKAEGELR
jgi:hypothetical protein